MRPSIRRRRICSEWVCSQRPSGRGLIQTARCEMAGQPLHPDLARLLVPMLDGAAGLR